MTLGSPRRAFLRSLAALAAASGIVLVSESAHAQQSSSPARIGVLVSNALPDDMARAFHQGLVDTGYSEGRDAVIDWQSADGDYNRLPLLAAKVVQSRVNVIVVDGTPAAQAAKHATATIPIVMVLVSDPVGAGLVRSLAHPGGNATGFSLMTTDLTAKRLQLLKEAIPRLSRAAVMWNPETAFHPKVIEAFKAAAPRLSINLTFVEARKPEELGPAFSAARGAHAEVFYVIDDGFFFSQRAMILKLASKSRLPVIYAAREFAHGGGLMSYGTNLADLWRRSAGYVDKILKGADPGDLPIEQPTKFELVVNLKTAKALGIAIPESVLLRADEVIQ